MICKLEIYNGELNLFPVVTNERVFAQITMGNIVKGQPGVTPHIDPETKHWMIGIENTNVVAEGKNGLVPHVGENGNWFIGEEDTRVKAQGKDGKPGPSGKPPYIGENGNWFTYGGEGQPVDTGLSGSQLELVSVHTPTKWDDLVNASYNNKLIMYQPSNNFPEDDYYPASVKRIIPYQQSINKLIITWLYPNLKSDNKNVGIDVHYTTITRGSDGTIVSDGDHQVKVGPSITFIELSSSNEGVTNVDYHDFHSDVLSGKGIMLLYNGEYTMVSNIVISEGILPHYDAYFFNNYYVDDNPYIKFYQVRFYHSGISGDNRLHYTIIDPLGTTIYNEYNLSLNLGETGIEVGMYGKSNYEEVISYDDLKSKLGL